MSLTDATTVAAYLGLTFTGPQTTEATALLPAADAAIAAYTGRAWLGGAVVSEVYQPDGPFLVLRQRPVTSIESMVARWAFATPTTTLTAGTHYRLYDAARGLVLLTPWRTGRPTDRPYEDLEVSYTPSATVPDDVALAATLLVAAWMGPSLAGDPNAPTGAVVRERVGDVDVQYAAPVQPAAGALPAPVQALLAPYRAALVFA